MFGEHDIDAERARESDGQRVKISRVKLTKNNGKSGACVLPLSLCVAVCRSQHNQRLKLGRVFEAPAVRSNC